ncbi:MAG: hypothetical protein AAGF23_20730 [Acidobacteriota bacterium]
MFDRRFVTAALLTAAVAALGLLPPLTHASDAPGRHPLARQAEAEFFDVFNNRPESPDAALTALMTAFFVDPDDAQTNRLLGLNHLWLAAEGDHQNPRTIEHLYLAEDFLRRAADLDPDDARMHSWLIPARLSLARIERDDARVEELSKAMREAYETDPNFHAFIVGVQGFEAPRDDPRFAFALEAMRSTVGCADSEDLSCANHPRWPHNIEAFLVFAADFELKAGDVDRAKELLETARRFPDFATWPYGDEVARRLATLNERAARYANADGDDDPPSLFTGANQHSCQMCHRTR